MIRKIIAKMSDEQLEANLTDLYLKIDDQWSKYMGNGMMKLESGVVVDVPLSKVRGVGFGKPKPMPKPVLSTETSKPALKPALVPASSSKPFVLK